MARGLLSVILLFYAFFGWAGPKKKAPELSARSLLYEYRLLQSGLMGPTSARDIGDFQRLIASYIQKAPGEDLATEDGKKLVELNRRLINSQKTFGPIQSCMKLAGVESHQKAPLYPDYKSLTGCVPEDGTTADQRKFENTLGPIIAGCKRQDTANLLKIVSAQAQENALYAALEFKVNMEGVASIATVAQRNQIVRDLFDAPAGSSYTKLTTQERYQLDLKAKNYAKALEKSKKKPLSNEEIIAKFNDTAADFKTAFAQADKETEIFSDKMKTYQAGLYGGSSKDPRGDILRFQIRNQPEAWLNPWIKDRVKQTFADGGWGILMFTKTMQEYFSLPLMRYMQDEPKFDSLPPKDAIKIVEEAKKEAYAGIRAYGQKVTDQRHSTTWMGSQVPLDEMRKRLKELIRHDPLVASQVLQTHPEQLKALCEILVEIDIDKKFAAKEKESAELVTGVTGLAVGIVLVVSQVGSLGAPAAVEATEAGLLGLYLTDAAMVAGGALGAYSFAESNSRADQAIKDYFDFKAVFFSRYGRDVSRYAEMNNAWVQYEEARSAAIREGLITLIFLPPTVKSLASLSDVEKLKYIQTLTQKIRSGLSKK